MKSALALTAGLTAALLTSGLGLANASAVIADEPIPTSTTMTDPKHDVSKNYGASGVRRKADLDLRRVSARLSGEVIVLTVKVADLRPYHLREDSGRTPVYAFLYFPGGLRWWVGWGGKNPYGVPEPVADAMRFNPERYLGDPSRECRAEDGVSSRFTQNPNYDKNTVTFTIPVECLPAGSETARVGGGTAWLRKGVDFWDDTTFQTRGDKFVTKKSAPFRFR